jgi:predicted dehydrogenase
MNKIRLAIIGTGLAWERLHLPALKELQDLYEVVAMCNHSEGKLKCAADEIGLCHENIYTDYTKMIERDDIDAVNILVPIEQNYEISKVCAKKGLNIICEKPLGADMEESVKYLELEKKYGVKILIAENFRYNEENNIIRDLVNSKAIGEVLYFIKNNIFDFEEEMKQDTFAAKEWRQYPKFVGGTFLDGGVHDIAGLQYIFGDVESVFAYGVKSEEEFSPYKTITSVLKFESGMIGNFIHSCSGKELQAPLVGLRIFGTEGEIYLEDKTCGSINISYKDNRESEIINYTPKKGFYNELKSFYEFLVNDNNECVKPEVEFKDVRTIFSILESIDSGKSVKVDGKIKFFTRVSSSSKRKVEK